MTTVLLVIHLMIAAALVGVVLIQKSEGGALGIGGGGGNFMTGRGTANLLTRITAALATGFFLTSLVLSILASGGGKPASILDQLGGQGAGTSAPATSGTSTGEPATSGTTSGASTEGGGATGGGAEPTTQGAPQSQ
ncbi:MAG: preprotein translocase subunit SecG [Hyphomicrobiaceae bacterium]